MIISQLLACKKLQLTRPTKKGADTFSCIIDNNVYKPCHGGLFGQPRLSANVAVYAGGEQIAVITARCNDNKPYRKVYMELRDFHGEGQYSLAGSSHKLEYEERYPDKRYITSPNTRLTITVSKFDPNNYILSGTFEGTLENIINASDKIAVKSGRFDIKYKN